MSDKGGLITSEKGIALDWRDRRIAELEGQLREAQATIAALRAQIVQLQQRIAELERTGQRQATPFARDEHKADPKRPGRNGAERRQSVPDGDAKVAYSASIYSVSCTSRAWMPPTITPSACA